MHGETEVTMLAEPIVQAVKRGVETVFVGQLEAGEIYNQAPVEGPCSGNATVDSAR